MSDTITPENRRLEPGMVMSREEARDMRGGLTDGLCDVVLTWVTCTTPLKLIYYTK